MPSFGASASASLHCFLASLTPSASVPRVRLACRSESPDRSRSPSPLAGSAFPSRVLSIGSTAASPRRSYAFAEPSFDDAECDESAAAPSASLGSMSYYARASRASPSSSYSSWGSASAGPCSAAPPSSVYLSADSGASKSAGCMSGGGGSSSSYSPPRSPSYSSSHSAPHGRMAAAPARAPPASAQVSWRAPASSHYQYSSPAADSAAASSPSPSASGGSGQESATVCWFSKSGTSFVDMDVRC